MSEVVYKGNDILVRSGKIKQNSVVVTFGPLPQSREDSNKGFGENVYEKLGFDEIHIISQSRNWYQSADMSKAISVVQELTKQHEKVITIGSSMGGFGVLTFSNLLNADYAISISGQYSIDPKIMPNESRWQYSKKRIDFI